MNLEEHRIIDASGSCSAPPHVTHTESLNITHTHTRTIVFSTSPRRNENRHESILLDDSDYNEILYTSICFCLHPPPLPVTHTRTPPPKHEHYGFIMSLPSLPHVPSLSKADGGSNILSPFSKCALFSMNAMECTL